MRGMGVSGILNMKIFLLGRRLFMYLETVDAFDLERDFAGYTESDKAKEWDDLMRDYQEPVSDAQPGDWWSAMEEVFDLNAGS